MKRLILSLLIAIPISVVVTVVLSLASGFAGGACHCMTPISVLFPYGTFITMRTSWETLGSYMHFLQFTFYAIVIALLDGPRKRLLASFVILVVHAIAALGALTMYRWW